MTVAGSGSQDGTGAGTEKKPVNSTDLLRDHESDLLVQLHVSKI